MPKYAVAVGRCVGIYDTYDECKAQVSGYPNPKFKKFETVQEAQEFINTYSKPTTSLLNSADHDDNQSRFRCKRPPSENNMLENILQRLSKLEEGFSQFRQSTTTCLEDLKNRLLMIENKLGPSNISRTDKNLTESHCLSSKRAKLENSPYNEIDHESFLRDENGAVIVYTDGACTNNGKKGAKAGIGVWFNHGHPLNISAPLIGPATNNNAEIQAARIAINQASKAGLTKLSIYTDSQFLIDCITAWINKWKKNNWKLSTGGDVKNKVELVKLDDALQQMQFVEWKHVRGHIGVEGNEMADRLARDGAELYNCKVTYSDYCDI